MRWVLLLCSDIQLTFNRLALLPTMAYPGVSICAHEQAWSGDMGSAMLFLFLPQLPVPHVATLMQFFSYYS